MIDYFALLHEPRRPWLDAEALKQTFLSLSASEHPDKVQVSTEPERQAASKKFAELNAAYNCLATPKLRLLHLVELERGTKPADIQHIPPALADLFAEVAAVCQDANRFLTEKSKANSPLLQVRFFERAQEWTEKLTGLQKKLAGFHGELLARLKSLDEQWTKNGSNHGELLNDLENLYRLFGYFNRWNAQIQELIFQLTL